MTTKQLQFIEVEAFRSLSLREKNAYLQTLSNKFAEANERETVTLDKDALSRLRRYYSRRVWADLKLETIGNSSIADSLRRLGQAIRDDGLEQDLAAALLSETKPRRILRQAPADDAQMMFFVPTLYDAPIKDDVNLMDVAPFAISKRSAPSVLRYELKDSLITVEGGAKSGLATVYDYDIFLHMVSHLADEVKRYRIAEGKGQRPSLPAKIFRPNASHILKFCRRSDGGKAYQDLEAALDRLSKTSIKVVNLSGGKRREVDSRNLIGQYRIVSRTGADYPDVIEMNIPDWIYTSIVAHDQRALPLLTLDADYFLISSGLGRALYRLARRAAGKTEAVYSLTEVHKRSGSQQDLRKFRYDLRSFVTRTQAFPLPGYDLELKAGKTDELLVMRRRLDEADGLEMTEPNDR